MKAKFDSFVRGFEILFFIVALLSSFSYLPATSALILVSSLTLFAIFSLIDWPFLEQGGKQTTRKETVNFLKLIYIGSKGVLIFTMLCFSAIGYLYVEGPTKAENIILNAIENPPDANMKTKYYYDIAYSTKDLAQTQSTVVAGMLNSEHGTLIKIAYLAKRLIEKVLHIANKLGELIVFLVAILLGVLSVIQWVVIPMMQTKNGELN